MKRLGRGEGLSADTDRPMAKIQVLQESGELLEDIKKENSGQDKVTAEREIKDAFVVLVSIL